MIETPRHDHHSTLLDADLLSTPFEVQTNWHVITGAPCSGKSTLIDLIKQRGYKTVPESARRLIQAQIAGGSKDHPIRVDGAALQRGILEMQLSVEARLQPSEVFFLDGAVPGTLAWCRVYGLDPNQFLPDCFHHRYASVFLLAPLQFRNDVERIPEMDAIAGYLDEWHTRDYTDLGYNVIRVPVLPPDERLAFVLERVAD